MESTIIAGQQGTYRHLPARVAELLANPGVRCESSPWRVLLPLTLWRVARHRPASRAPADRT